jgi:beta-glucosidase-like glycosyl hydrolase
MRWPRRRLPRGRPLLPLVRRPPLLAHGRRCDGGGAAALLKCVVCSSREAGPGGRAGATEMMSSSSAFMAMASLITPAIARFSGAKSPSCTWIQGYDCPGGDVGMRMMPIKSGNASQLCCATCASNSSCAVAVLAITADAPICMLKSTAVETCAPHGDRLVCLPAGRKLLPGLPAPRLPVPPNNAKIRLHGCLRTDLLALPFCDPKLSVAERAADLRARLTQEEMIGLLSTPSSPVPRLGLPQYEWGVEDDHGAGTACFQDVHGAWHCPTIFPTLSIVGASFNESLFYHVGSVIGREMRAANNAGATRARHARPGEPLAAANLPIGVNGWGPNLNLQRDPRWGRNSEVPSEDSYLAGKVGGAMTRGIQQLDSNGKFVLLLGALKHVTAYSLENWEDDTGGPNHGRKYSRFGFDGIVSRRDLAENYLEQYRLAISEGNALGMMCSYSAINGTASCENAKLLSTWARGSQGFEGNVVTDCGALSMASEPNNTAVSAADALNAGTDLNCGKVYAHGVANAISQGLTSSARLNATVERSFRLLMRAGCAAAVRIDRQP